MVQQVPARSNIITFREDGLKSKLHTEVGNEACERLDTYMQLYMEETSSPVQPMD
jgi:hypothetical protein